MRRSVVAGVSERSHVPSVPAESPGAPHFARSGNNNNTAEGVTGDLTRRWAVGPANYYYYYYYYYYFYYYYYYPRRFARAAALLGAPSLVWKPAGIEDAVSR
mgnify:CR=1 FL=1